MKVISTINLFCGSVDHFEILVGKSAWEIENNGIMYGKDGYMFQHYTTADTERIETNTEFINEFVQMYPQLNITMGIIPNSYMVYPEKCQLAPAKSTKLR